MTVSRRDGSAQPAGQSLADRTPVSRLSARGRRLLLWVVAAGVVVLLAWLSVCYVVIVKPATDAPVKVDAVVVLGPPDANDRYDEALSLVRAGYTNTLVLSAVTTEQPALYDICLHGLSGVQIHCFYPQPTTTQGEARRITSLAAQYGWKKIIVVTSAFHVSRARMIIQRCFPGQLLMVGVRKGIGLTQWAYQFLYQTGAYAKAFLHPEC
jgi:hypothetical protein